MRVLNWRILKDNKKLRIIFDGEILLITILILSLNLFAQTKFDGYYKGYITGDLGGGIEFTVNNEYYNNVEGFFWLYGDREHAKIIYGRVTDNGKLEAYLYDKKELVTTSLYRGSFVGEFNGKWFSGTWIFNDTSANKRESSKGIWQTTDSNEVIRQKFSLKVISGHAFISQESKYSNENIVFKDDDIYEGKWTELHRGDTMKFEPFFVMRTPPDSKVLITDPNGTSFTLNSNTFAQFISTKFIRVARGEAKVLIENDGLDYQVWTPSGKIYPLKVIEKKRSSSNINQFFPTAFSFGASPSVAEFLVKVEPNGTTICSVLEGTVDISDIKKSKTVRLLKNQSAVIKTGGLPSVPVAFNQNTIDRWWENSGQKVDSISAKWNGEWQSKWGKVVIVQNGNEVTGTYEHDNGKIKGTIVGNKLTGTWSEAPTYLPPNDAGEFEMILSPDGKSFTGKWRYGTNGKWEIGWNGSRLNAIFKPDLKPRVSRLPTFSSV